MSISTVDISALENSINSLLRDDNMSFKMSVHFVRDRINDPRNVPLIQISELSSIFNRLMAVHKQAILKLNHNDTFNIRCSKSHINMPCAVNKVKGVNGEHHENIVITVMRKESWKSKDAIQFVV